ncbi:MAG: hypothetical protein DRP22_01365 [Verrucomicrobia bacterium]|nr:MAG: hypothetical protein DRP22_01365 [Verrucomicrobiota bacterium]
MRIIVAGVDRSSDLGDWVRHRASRMKRRPLVRRLSPEDSALSLAGMESEGRFRARYLELLRRRVGVEVLPPVRRRGAVSWAAWAFRRLLWRVIRPFLEDIAWQQGIFNELVVDSLEQWARADAPRKDPDQNALKEHGEAR